MQVVIQKKKHEYHFYRGAYTANEKFQRENLQILPQKLYRILEKIAI